MADGTETAVSSIALRIHHQHVVSGELGAGKNEAGLVGSKFISINRASGTCRTLVRSKTHTHLFVGLLYEAQEIYIISLKWSLHLPLSQNGIPCF